jgi:hypothetical protein
MHIAICTILMASGYLPVLTGMMKKAGLIFTQLKALPEFNMIEQENFFKGSCAALF